MDPNGIVLVGAAAESYVKLQWLQFYVGMGIFGIFLIVVGMIGYHIWKDIYGS